MKILHHKFVLPAPRFVRAHVSDTILGQRISSYPTLLMNFNHRGYNPDGIQTGRFSGACWSSAPSCAQTAAGGRRNSVPRLPLIAEVGGSFRQIVAAYGTRRIPGLESKSSWTATDSMIPRDKLV